MITADVMQIYVSKAGLRYGPYSLEELRGQLEHGVFTPRDFASDDGGRNWEPIRMLPGVELPAFAVQADGAKNVLVIRYCGRVDAPAVARCVERVRSKIVKLEPGFQLLVDLTDLESMDVASVPHIEAIMKLCDEKGVTTVVRVIPDPKRDIGLQILSHFHYAADVRIVTCKSMDEARKRLEE